MDLRNRKKSLRLEDRRNKSSFEQFMQGFISYGDMLDLDKHGIKKSKLNKPEVYDETLFGLDQEVESIFNSMQMKGTR